MAHNSSALMNTTTTLGYCFGQHVVGVGVRAFEKVSVHNPNFQSNLTFTFFYLACTIFLCRYYLLWRRFLKHPGDRVPRSSSLSPSHKTPPANSDPVKRWNLIVHAASKWSGLLPQVSGLSQGKGITPCSGRSRIVKHLSDNGKEKATVMRMDHVYIPFPLFVIGDMAAGISSSVWAAATILLLRLRVSLHRWGWIAPKSGFDASKLVAGFCLESSIAIQYVSTNDHGNSLFCITDFPVVEQDGTLHFYDLFVVEIDLSRKRMVSATLDAHQVSASQAFILLWYYTFAVCHPQEHSLANWGCNIEYKQFWRNPWVAWNSLISVMYNHYGFHNYCNSAVPYSQNLGLLHPNWTPEAFHRCLHHGESSRIPSHLNISDLVRSSNLVRFLVLLRPMFMKQFQKHKRCFPGMDFEGFFVCTVVHSVDHAKTGLLIQDELWLDVDDERFGLMAEMGRIARAAFTTSVPIHPFPNKFKTSRHPFYRAVYQKASKIDQELADMMETCMCE